MMQQHACKTQLDKYLNERIFGVGSLLREAGRRHAFVRSRFEEAELNLRKDDR